jgi:cyclopropane fatty-acyl-phospholipid synthase-like methyltransferase
VNRASYNAIASAWDAARTAFSGRERAYVDALLDGLPVPSRLLDLGCGTGRPIAAHLLACGHRVTGVDQAEDLLALARARLPAATWVHAAIEDYRPAEPFDAIVCWDALFHLERTRHAALFARSASWLRPGGRLMLTFGGSDHPAFTDTMFGRTFFYDSHPPETALALLERAGFRVLLSEFLNPPTLGRDKGRYAVVAARRTDEGSGK